MKSLSGDMLFGHTRTWMTFTLMIIIQASWIWPQTKYIFKSIKTNCFNKNYRYTKKVAYNINGSTVH
jgi:hypothetical protein